MKSKINKKKAGLLLALSCAFVAGSAAAVTSVVSQNRNLLPNAVYANDDATPEKVEGVTNVVATVDRAVSLTINEGLVMNFKVKINDSYTDSYTLHHAIFKIDGVADVWRQQSFTKKDGAYIFRCEGLDPSMMQRKVQIYVFAENAEGEMQYVACRTDESGTNEESVNITDYLYAFYNAQRIDDQDMNTKVLVSDLLHYAGAIEKFIGKQGTITDSYISKTDDSQNYDYSLNYAGVDPKKVFVVEEDKITGYQDSVYTKTNGTNVQFEGEPFLNLSSMVRVVFPFTLGEGLTLDDVTATTDNGGRVKLEKGDVVNDVQTYRALVSVKMPNFGDAITLTLKVGEDTATFQYSPKVYIALTQNKKENGELTANAKAVRAVWTYAQSCMAYEDKEAYSFGWKEEADFDNAGVAALTAKDGRSFEIAMNAIREKNGYSFVDGDTSEQHKLLASQASLAKETPYGSVGMVWDINSALYYNGGFHSDVAVKLGKVSGVTYDVDSKTYTFTGNATSGVSVYDANAVLAFDDSGAMAWFVTERVEGQEQGTLTIQKGSYNTAFLNATGTVTIAEGVEVNIRDTLNVNGLSIAEGATVTTNTLNLTGGTCEVVGGLTLSNLVIDGDYNVSDLPLTGNETITLKSGTVDFDNEMTLDELTLNGGAYTGNLNVTNLIVASGTYNASDLSSASAITINGGTVNFDNEEKLDATITLNGGAYTGNLNVTNLIVASGTYNDAIDLSSATKVTVNAGTFNGAVTAADITVNGGTFSNTVTAADITVNGGTFSSTVTATNDLTVSDGTVGDISATNNMTLSGGTFNGTVTADKLEIKGVTLQKGAVTATTSLTASSGSNEISNQTITTNLFKVTGGEMVFGHNTLNQKSDDKYTIGAVEVTDDGKVTSHCSLYATSLTVNSNQSATFNSCNVHVDNLELTKGTLSVQSLYVKDLTRSAKDSATTDLTISGDLDITGTANFNDRTILVGGTLSVRADAIVTAKQVVTKNFAQYGGTVTLNSDGTGIQLSGDMVMLGGGLNITSDGWGINSNADGNHHVYFLGGTANFTHNGGVGFAALVSASGKTAWVVKGGSINASNYSYLMYRESGASAFYDKTSYGGTITNTCQNFSVGDWGMHEWGTSFVYDSSWIILLKDESGMTNYMYKDNGDIDFEYVAGYNFQHSGDDSKPYGSQPKA